MKKTTILLLLFLIIFNTCKKDKSTSDDPKIYTISKSITASQGGTITTPDGSQIVIPEGALQSDANITIQTIKPKLNSDATIKPASNFYKMGPDGSVFKAPINITLPYSTADIPEGEAESQLTVFVNNGAEFVVCPSTLDPVKKTISFWTIHFSDYIIGTPTGISTTGPSMGNVNMVIKNNKVYATFRLDNLFESPGVWWSDQNPWWSLQVFSFNDLMKGDGQYNPTPGWYYIVNLEKENTIIPSLIYSISVLSYLDDIYIGGNGYHVQVTEQNPLYSAASIHLAGYTDGNGYGGGLTYTECATAVSGEGLLVPICDLSQLSSTSKYFVQVHGSACAVYSNSNYDHFVAYSNYKQDRYGRSTSQLPVNTPNLPPTTPTNPFPSNGSNNISLTVKLSWASSDPDGDALTYDVYFGTNTTPTVKVGTDLITGCLTKSGLNAGIPYYWKVVAKDNQGHSTTGNVWSFTTIAQTGSAPVADFTANNTTITAGQSVQFTDQSTNTPTSWSWNFGDGGTSAQQNPTHTYSTAGSFSVSLTSNNSIGSNAKTKTSYITVSTAGIAPVAAFTANNTSITAGQSVQFTDQSTNTPTSWSWNFGDGGTSTQQSPSHTYTTAGTYTVSLTATNSFGFNTITKTNYISVSNGDICMGCEKGTVNDNDGNTYNTVKIGTQWWMSENLKTTKYRNGDIIGTTTPSTLDISGESIPKYQWNLTKYGNLYTWYTVTDSRNVCPIGWHIPSESEWCLLIKYIDPLAKRDLVNFKSSVSGGKMKEAGITHWESPNTGATNESGFTALPDGQRTLNGLFYQDGWDGTWWSSSADGTSTKTSWFIHIYHDNANVITDIDYSGKGLSVRCLKD